MIEVRDKRVLVVGLARSGRAAARCLRRRGALVTVTDSRPPWELRADIPELLAHKIGMELGLHREETFLRQDLIVISPGVPAGLPYLEAARKKNIPVVPEVEAASWFLEGPLVGVTGSNGKTTTTALLGKVFKASGFRTFVGGNIGVPLISAVDEVPRDTLLVAELSSFQLETIRDFRPGVAVLLNLTPNHLDRHPSFDAYVRAKAQIFRNQTADDFAVLNADDPLVVSLARDIASRKIWFSRRQNLPDGVLVSDGRILYRVGNLERVLLETREVPLRGEFNAENVLAAAAAACVLGADFAALRRAVREFSGVEHRLEYVRDIRGVEFYNDSKATSVDAAAKALSAFERGVHLILGGKDKGAPYAPLRPLFEGRVTRLYLIGAAAERIARELEGAAEIVEAGDLETAVRQAFGQAIPGDVILLSPACASFDQFEDFEHRGRVFKEVAERLAREVEPSVAGRAEKRTSRGVPARSLQPELPGFDGEATQEPPGSLEGTAGEPVPPAAGPECEAVSVSGAGEVAELAPPSLGKDEPAQPSGPAVTPAAESRRPEPVYVYEVDAEEVGYRETEIAGDASEPLAPEQLGSAETVEDEPLPFEVRVGANDPQEAESRSASQKRDAEGSEHESPPSILTGGQGQSGT
jgi:UDP-N-acetylmuramoylalanine--D-glutamate ligase